MSLSEADKLRLIDEEFKRTLRRHAEQRQQRAKERVRVLRRVAEYLAFILIIWASFVFAHAIVAAASAQ